MTMPAGMLQNLPETVSVLSVEPAVGDQEGLRDIFLSSSWPMCPGSRWKLSTSHGVQPALSVLHENSAALVLCESETTFGTWKEMLEATSILPDPPLLIVTSRLADDRLWAEALNLGAYDVLAKPYQRTEVIRVLSVAWLHWRNRHSLPRFTSEDKKTTNGDRHADNDPARRRRLTPPRVGRELCGVPAHHDRQQLTNGSDAPGKSLTIKSLRRGCVGSRIALS